MTTISKAASPGYQGSETSGAEVTIYPQKGDPVRVKGEDILRPEAKRIDDPVGGLLSVQTSKLLGPAAGTWSIRIKPSRVSPSLLNQIMDDDWVDIVLTRHGRKWHVMRGLVDDIREVTETTGSGATVQSLAVSGRDFGSIFDRTQVWFSPYVDEAITGGVSFRVFNAGENILGSPSEAVQGFLLGFLKELSGVGRATWDIPKSVPSVGGQAFGDVVLYDDDQFQNIPARTALSPNYLMPEGGIWSLAQEWSDGAFCELFCDTVHPYRRFHEQEDEERVEDTVMLVTFRDRPFPLVDAALTAAGMNTGLSSNYFGVPMHHIPRQLVRMENVGRGGPERYNAFFVSPQLAQELYQASAVDLLAPLWDEDSIQRHGLRRFDIQSRYVADQADLLTMSELQRRKIKDWHCINPYLLNGSIELARGFPKIHVGDRVRIPGYQPKLDRTYYVEQVDHSWQFGSSIKTTLGVTRGWVGTDESYLNALSTLSGRYKVPGRAEPGDYPVTGEVVA